MRCKTFCLSYVILLWIFIFSSDSIARSRALTIDQAVSLALEQNSKIKQANWQLEEVGAKRKSVRGQMFPKLSVDANLFYWDDEVEFDLMGDINMSSVDPSCAPTLGCLMPLLEGFDVGPVREQLTSQLTVQLVQPITPLYAIYNGYRATRLGEDAARSGIKMSKQQVVAEVKKGYIQVKQAEGGVTIAQSAVEQVETQLKKARAFEKAGLIGRNDILKLEVAKARTLGVLLEARSGLSMAQSALAIAIGLSPEETVVTIQKFDDPPPSFNRTIDQCYEDALKQRPEIAVVNNQVGIAQATKNAAIGAMIPQIVALGAYQHNEGQGFVSPKNVWFVGASLQWDVWSWGSKYYGYKEASTKIESVKLDEKQLRDGIYLQVKKSYVDLQTASQGLTIARVAVDQAEENYRIEKSKYDNNSATTADIIDAHAALTQAKQMYNNALYSWYLSHAALDQATGQAIAAY